MGYRFPTFDSPAEKARIAAKLAVKKAERSAQAKWRTRYSPSFSSAKRRSWKVDQFGFDRAEKIDT